MSTDHSTPVSAVDELMATMATAIAAWKEANPPEVVTKHVHEKLNQASNKVLLSIMGFEQDSWNGRWRIDHCNGRSGNSPIGDYLNQVQNTAIREWIEKVGMPELTEQETADLRESIRTEYMATVQRSLVKAVQEQAIKDVRTLVEQVTQSYQLENFMRMRDLLINTKT